MNLERHRNLLDYSISFILRRKGRNLATILVFTLVIFTISSVVMLTTSLTQEARETLSFAPDITVQKILAGRQSTLDESYVREIEDIKGVSKVVKRIWGYYYDSEADATYTIYAFNPEKFNMAEELSLALEEGRFLSSEDTKACVIGKALAQNKGLRPGDRIILLDHKGEYVKLTVAGVFSSPSSLVSGDLLVVPEQEARELFGMKEGEYTDLAVYVSNPNEITNIARKIKDRLPDARVLEKKQIQQTYEAIFGWRSGMFMAGLISSLLAFAILVWDRASGMSAEERREIGILKALGWETRDILEMKSFEGLVISLNSYILGILLAYVHVFLLGAPILKPVLIGWSTLYPDFILKPALSFGELMIIFFVSVLPYMAAIIIPSWRASTISPEVAMRGI